MSESSKDQSTPALDLSRVAFPLDNVTIGTLRRTTSVFDKRDHDMFADFEAGVLTERMIARQAFDAELQGVKPSRMGKINLERALDRREWVDGMDQLYQIYGLSSGRKQSAELVRGIESQAVAQAREILGKSR